MIYYLLRLWYSNSGFVIGLARDEEKDAVLAQAKKAIADKLTGNIVKEIYVPGRIINIVQR